MTTLVKVEPLELEKVVQNSGLAIQEGEEIKQSYLPFINRLAEIQAQANKINFEQPNQLDELVARDLRLQTVKVRTGAGDLKDGRKKIFLLKGNLEQAAFNLIKASCELTENTFLQIEKAREIAEKKRQEERKVKRVEILTALNYDFAYIDLLKMEDEKFDNLVIMIENERDAKIEREKQAEKERLAKIEAERIENERIRIENERLKKDAEEKEKQAKIEREKIEKEREVERKKQAEILAKQQAESKEKERIEAEKQSKIHAELKAKAEKEQKERQRIEKELQAKKDAEIKAENERIAKEKSAAAAPDKEKLELFAKLIESIVCGELSFPEAQNIAISAKGLLAKVSVYIREKSKSL